MARLRSRVQKLEAKLTDQTNLVVNSRPGLPIGLRKGLRG
jgi:hypothetical protein